jgi:hypothetical protein
MHRYVVRAPKALGSMKWHVAWNDELESSVRLEHTPHTSDYLTWLFDVLKSMKADDAVNGFGADSSDITYNMIEVSLSISRRIRADLNTDAMRRTQIREQRAVTTAKIQRDRFFIGDIEEERGTFLLRHT